MSLARSDSDDSEYKIRNWFHNTNDDEDPPTPSSDTSFHSARGTLSSIKTSPDKYLPTTGSHSSFHSARGTLSSIKTSPDEYLPTTGSHSSFRSARGTFSSTEEDCCKEKTDEIDEKIKEVKKRIAAMHKQLDDEFEYTQKKFGRVLFGEGEEIGRAKSTTP